MCCGGGRLAFVGPLYAICVTSASERFLLWFSTCTLALVVAFVLPCFNGRAYVDVGLGSSGSGDSALAECLPHVASVTGLQAAHPNRRHGPSFL